MGRLFLAVGGRSSLREGQLTAMLGGGPWPALSSGLGNNLRLPNVLFASNWAWGIEIANVCHKQIVTNFGWTWVVCKCWCFISILDALHPSWTKLKRWSMHGNNQYQSLGTPLMRTTWNCGAYVFKLRVDRWAICWMGTLVEASGRDDKLKSHSHYATPSFGGEKTCETWINCNEPACAGTGWPKILGSRFRSFISSTVHLSSHLLTHSLTHALTHSLTGLLARSFGSIFESAAKLCPVLIRVTNEWFNIEEITSRG